VYGKSFKERVATALVLYVQILYVCTGITGKVSIDENGDRNADYSLLDLDPETGLFEVRLFMVNARLWSLHTKINSDSVSKSIFAEVTVGVQQSSVILTAHQLRYFR